MIELRTVERIETTYIVKKIRINESREVDYKNFHAHEWGSCLQKN